MAGIIDVEAEIKRLQLELDKARGRRGACSQCGEEKKYADREAKLCNSCYRANMVAENRLKYTYLLGRRIVDLIIHTSYHPLQGLILEGGVEMTVERDYDGDVHFNITGPRRKAALEKRIRKLARRHKVDIEITNVMPGSALLLNKGELSEELRKDLEDTGFIIITPGSLNELLIHPKDRG